MKRSLASLSILLVALLGCATTTPYNPFNIPREELYGKVKTIALAPIFLPEDLENQERLKTKFESLIDAKLREAGFSVIPSKEYSEIWKRMTEQMGGYFDPVTGNMDESKFKAVKEHSRRELVGKFNANAVLFSGIYIVKAFYSDDGFSNIIAKWDGIEEKIDTRDGLIRFLDSTSRYGNVGALSMEIIIEDIQGTALYVNRGGIQVLHKFSGGKKGFVRVPNNELLVNEERNVSAVNIVLEPLIRKSESPEPSQSKQ